MSHGNQTRIRSWNQPVLSNECKAQSRPSVACL